MNWRRYLKGKIRRREPLSRYTTFKIGGPAEFFIEPADIEDLRVLIALAKKNKLPFRVMGRGSNILANDNGLKGLILRLGSPFFKKINIQDNIVEAGSGVMLQRLILEAVRHNLSGLESLTGIPGTVGGALVMNAGQGRDGFSIGSLLDSMRIMDYNGRVRILERKDITFKYRSLGLSRYIILSARLKLKRRDGLIIQKKINRYLRYRLQRQDLSCPSAGCVFKNPDKVPAGRLIDLCGLKGRSIGGASISRKHANFILNSKAARAKDVLQLMRLAKRAVKGRFGILLEPEIKIWS